MYIRRELLSLVHITMLAESSAWKFPCGVRFYAYLAASHIKKLPVDTR